jgi:hypothetical protein
MKRNGTKKRGSQRRYEIKPCIIRNPKSSVTASNPGKLQIRGKCTAPTITWELESPDDPVARQRFIYDPSLLLLFALFLCSTLDVDYAFRS